MLGDGEKEPGAKDWGHLEMPDKARKQTLFSPGVFRMNATCPHLDFTPVRPISDV